jgi:hypothetical protein
MPVRRPFGVRVVKKMKALMLNPYLLGAQGFIAGALFLWAGNLPLEFDQQAAVPPAEVQLVPSVS